MSAFRTHNADSYQGSGLIMLTHSLDMAGLKYLATALETMEDPENPECESEGFLLEKGVKETFADLFVKMKMLRGGNEVEGGEAAEAT
ncbi:hypothetical protein F7725_023556 [Dissostichus mawsoni]|uniref:Uncharacterized protein n=1 Tax=Dissostichus mawsoni TaxID=36200 RepID=A0A7J5XWV7_DISMA|nr:hypothetical protein F7725_023556 [Dissostichus mawsoni]